MYVCMSQCTIANYYRLKTKYNKHVFSYYCSTLNAVTTMSIYFVSKFISITSKEFLRPLHYITLAYWNEWIQNRLFGGHTCICLQNSQTVEYFVQSFRNIYALSKINHSKDSTTPSTSNMNKRLKEWQNVF